MVRLVIEVTGVPKWVTVEDLSGPTIKFDGMLQEDRGVEVDIHSRGNEAANVIVYAGRYRGQRTAKLHEENLRRPCTLILSDDVVGYGGRDAENPPKCEWKNILDDAAADQGDDPDDEQEATAVGAMTGEASSESKA